MGMSLKDVEKYLQTKVDPSFQFVDNRGKAIPFTRLNKSISEAKVAFISSGGFHLKEEPAFDTEDPQGDASFRKIPKDAKLEDLGIAHTHYKHDYVLSDLNCALPLEILQELAEEGVIGQLADTNYSFMGYILKTDELINETALQVAMLLKEESVEAVILAPT